MNVPELGPSMNPPMHNGHGPAIHVDGPEGSTARVHTSHRDRGRYKEKYASMRERYEKAARSQEVYQKQFEIASAKIKKLQAENDFLLDTLIFDENTYNSYWPLVSNERSGIRPSGLGNREKSNIFNDLPSNRQPYPPHPVPPFHPPMDHPAYQGVSPLPYGPLHNHDEYEFVDQPPASGPSRKKRGAVKTNPSPAGIPHPDQAIPLASNNQSLPPTPVDPNGAGRPHQMQQIQIHTPTSPTPPGHGGHSFGRYPIMQTNGRGERSPPPPPPAPADPNNIIILNQDMRPVQGRTYERPLEFIQHDVEGRISR